MADEEIEKEEKERDRGKTASEKQTGDVKNHFLVVLDIFSRYAWVRHIPNSKSESTFNAFNDIFETSKSKPKRLWTDQGGEFTGLIDKSKEQEETDFQCDKCEKYFKTQGALTTHIKDHCPVLHTAKAKEEPTKLKDVEIYFAYGRHKASIAERFIRTLKDKIGRWMTNNDSTDYLPHIQSMVEEYNNTPHRNFKSNYTPAEARDPRNEKKIYELYYRYPQPTNYKDHITQKTDLKIGDLVRIQRKKGDTIGEKGFTPSWTKEIFIINKIKETLPTTYYLKDANNYEIRGPFYREELQKTKFKITDDMGFKKPRTKNNVMLGKEAVGKEAARQLEKKRKQRERNRAAAEATAKQNPEATTKQTKQTKQTEKTEKTDFQCEDCKKYFASKKTLKKHRNNSCPVIKAKRQQEEPQPSTSQSADGLNISDTIKNIPIKSLTNFELEAICKKFKGWRGVFSRDTLPNKPNLYECGIVNLDDSEGKGTHWVCYHRNKKLKFYFDSYGLPPPLEVKDYLKSPILYSTDQIQDPNSVICGHLCIFVLEKLSQGWHIQPIINHLLDLKEEGYI